MSYGSGIVEKKKHSWNWLIEVSCDLSTNNSIEQLELGKEMFFCTWKILKYFFVLTQDKRNANWKGKENSDKAHPQSA